MAELEGTTVCHLAEAVTQVAELENTTSAVLQNHKGQRPAEAITQMAELKGTTVGRLAEAVAQVAEIEGTKVCRRAEPPLNWQS